MSRKFDVVIVGGGVIGSSAAYFLAAQEAFGGSIAVIERDPTYGEAATPRSAGGIRRPRHRHRVADRSTKAAICSSRPARASRP